VQQVLRLSPELGSIKFTVGLFYIPGGKSTQHSGVSSDIVFPSPLNSDEIGEKSLDYSLPPNSVKAFLSKTAYASEGSAAWTPVDRATVAKLKGKSKDRIAKSEDFKKILKEVKESKAKGNAISIAEILSDKNSEAIDKRKKLRAMTKDERRDEYVKSAEIQEAVNIAVDLALQQNKKIAKK